MTKRYDVPLFLYSIAYADLRQANVNSLKTSLNIDGKLT